MRFLLLLAVSFYALTAHAAADDPNEIYVCTEDEATGFNWANGKWVKASFKLETYVVKRIPLYKFSTPDAMREHKTFMCSTDQKIPSFDDKTYRIDAACYSIVRLGEAMSPATYTPCKENFIKGKLDSVECASPTNFTFSPKGQFIKQPWHSDVSTSGKKDSLVLSVGKCKQTKLD